MFDVSFTAVLRVAEERFAADEDITDSMVQLQRKEEKEEKKRGKARAGQADGQGGRRKRPRHCGQCCMLTMRALHRDHLTA